MAKSRKDQIQELLTLDPDDAFLRYGLAMEYVGEGDDETAIRCLRDLLGRSPDYVPGYQQLGQAYRRLARLAEARDAFGRGIEAAQRQGEAHAAQEMQEFLAALD